MRTTRTKTFGCIPAVLVCLFAFAPKAEAKQDAFKDVPSDHWTFYPKRRQARNRIKDIPSGSWTLPSLDRLSSKYLKYPFFYHGDGRLRMGSSWYPTRYEGTVYLQSILAKVEKIDAEKPDKKTMDVTTEERQLLKRLVEEFWKELLELGYFDKHVLFKLPDQIFIDITEHENFAYALDIVWMKLTGKRFFARSLYSGRRYYTRYEAAVALQRFFQKNRVDMKKSMVASTVLSAEERRLLECVIEEFKQELAALGYDVKPFLGMAPFPDVPRTHWAVQAVTELKKAGILVGYPDPIENTFLPKQSASR